MNLIKELEQFALSPNEAKVYLALLSLGPSSMQQISAEAKINRVTVYGLAEGLIKKGFLYEEKIKNKNKIVAYSPMKLYDVLSREFDQIKQKEKHLDVLIPQLKQIRKKITTRTNVIYYEGEEGLRNWASDALETKGELLEWTKIESFTEKFEDYLASYYYPKKFELQIPTRFIFLDTPEARQYVYRYTKNKKASPMKARFVPKEQFDTPGFMVIFNNRYSIAIPSEMRAVTIEDKLIADAQRKIFEFGWLHAKDEVQNKPYPFDKR